MPAYMYKRPEQRPHVFTCLMSSEKRLLAATFLGLTAYPSKMETILKEAKVIFLEAFLILCFSHSSLPVLVKIQKCFQ